MLPSGTRSRNTVSSGRPSARAARSTTSGPFSGLTPTWKCGHTRGQNESSAMAHHAHLLHGHWRPKSTQAKDLHADSTVKSTVFRAD